METLHPLRQWREEHDVTLAALASEAEVTASHLSEIERGKNGMSLKLTARLSEITGISMEKLAEGVAA